MGLERRGRVKRSHDRGNWKQEDFDACDRQAVRLACLLDGSRLSREVHVRLCDQEMQVWTVGDRPTEVKVRSLVAWIAGRREIEFPKPIDKAIFRMVSKSSGRGAADKAANLAGCKSPCRQLPVFGRLACPVRAEVTKHVLPGLKSLSCPVAVCTAVGTIWEASKLGGLNVMECLQPSKMTSA